MTNELIKFGKKLGFTHTITGGNHIKFEGHGYTKVMASSASDYRVLRKVKKDLTAIVAGKPNRFCHPINVKHSSSTSRI